MRLYIVNVSSIFFLIRKMLSIKKGEVNTKHIGILNRENIRIAEKEQFFLEKESQKSDRYSNVNGRYTNRSPCAHQFAAVRSIFVWERNKLDWMEGRRQKPTFSFFFLAQLNIRNYCKQSFCEILNSFRLVCGEKKRYHKTFISMKWAIAFVRKNR